MARSTSRARCACCMSRGIMPGTARLTRASSSPVSKWTTGSVSRLVYGWPQRRTGMFSMRASVDPHRRDARDRPPRAHPADAVPRIGGVGRLALALVALEEARHEELAGQRREPDAAGLAVVDDPLRPIGIDDLDHGARLRGVVADLVAVLRAHRFRRGQAHQRVAVDRRDVDAVEQLLDGEARPLRGELGPAREDPRDAGLLDAAALLLEAERERLEQLRGREHAADVVAGAQDGDRLVDHVLLVGLEVLGPALVDQLDDPARVEVDAEADPAAVLREVLDRQAQPARPRRAEHQPVRTLGEVLRGERSGVEVVVGAEVDAGDAALRDAGGAAGLEDEDRRAL